MGNGLFRRLQLFRRLPLQAPLPLPGPGCFCPRRLPPQRVGPSGKPGLRNNPVMAKIQFTYQLDGKPYSTVTVDADARMTAVSNHVAYFCPVTGTVWARCHIIGAEPATSYGRNHYPWMRSAPGLIPWHSADRPGSLILDAHTIPTLPRSLLIRELFLSTLYPQPR